MIQFVEMECPNCGGELQKTGDKTAKCSHCKAEFLIDTGQPEHITNIYQTPQPKPKKSAHLLTLACIFLGMAGLMAVRQVNKLSLSRSHSPAPIAEQASEPETSERAVSEFFDALARKLYGAPWEKVTPEQFAQLTDLHIFWENGCSVAEYAMKDGPLKRAELPSGLSVCYSDLQCFTGLKRLNLEHANLNANDLEGLNALTQVWTSNSPEELAGIIQNPRQIISLGCYSLDTVTGIDAFENLEQLYLKDSDLSDIGALSSLKHLKDLTIENGDEITDFGVLHSLTELERLAIFSEGLKDISFLQNMANLKDLAIEDSAVLELTPMEGLTGLIRLCLKDNSSISDYSVLSGLAGLEHLELELAAGASMPSPEHWSQLKSLSVRGADSISFLSALPQLQSLSISGSDCSDYPVLSGLTSLENLTLKSIYGDIADLTVLTQMGSLKSLDLQSLSLYGTVEYIFGIPALEELNINDCSFGLDFAVMPENPNLKRLYMSRLKVLENISADYDGAFTYLDYDEVSLAEHMDFLGKFPNLEELYTQGNQLTDVTFAGNLPLLKKLDITDNYVTDLRPLEKLSNLETVWCGENSISQGGNLAEGITVILDSEAEGDAW